MDDDKPISLDELSMITWVNYGDKIFPKGVDKFSLTRKEKQILKVLLYKNRPGSYFRRKLWMASSGALREMTNNPNYYKNLLDYTKTFDYLPTENQIDLDLKRTFPDEPRCYEEKFLKQLKNILLCYSVRNSTVGYCQGMNFIVGKLLLVMEDEESAFWLFVQIIEFLLPINYYSDLAGIIIDTTMMSILIQKYMPDLSQYFIKNQFELTVNNFIHKWLVGLFTQNFNYQLSDIILDFFFLEGSIILTKTCLGVFAILRPVLMSFNDFEDVYETLNEKTNEIRNDKLILHFLAVRKFEFNAFTLNLFRESLKEPIIENLRKEKLKRRNSKSSLDLRGRGRNGKRHCNQKWPFCLYDMTPRDVLQVLVIKTSKRPYVIDDYYYSKANGYPKEQRGAIDEYFVTVDKDVLCERRKHHCDDRKLIESSIVMLDENKTRSNSNEGSNKNIIEKNETNWYKIVSKGKEFQKAKNKIMSDFSPSLILDSELNEYK